MIYAQVLVGQYEEPFLEAALRSVAWVDHYVVVNTDPEGLHGQENERIVRRTVPREKLTVKRLWMGKFDFARARNEALAVVPDGDTVLILDSDDVHWPKFEHLVRSAAPNYDMVAAHFWHHCVYKNLWHSKPHREILFRQGPGVEFHNTMGTVHEELLHPREAPALMDYDYNHYGYVKPARDIARRWEFYRSLGAEIHDYDRDRPDHAMDAWPEICHVYTGEHPPAVRALLEAYPKAPPEDMPKLAGAPRVGLVLLTWNDAENLKGCLETLDFTQEPFELMAVDNRSNDDTIELLETYREQHPDRVRLTVFTGSLTEALNIGFREFMNSTSYGLDYIGWIHPDHSFEWPDWLTQLREAMDAHPEWVKLGCQEADEPGHGLRAGNSQCFIVRRSALEEVGLFDERFLACGGYEDWEMNYRLLKVGRVMIWPDAVVRHTSMSTRSRHDNNAAALANSQVYTELTGLGEAPV